MPKKLTLWLPAAVLLGFLFTPFVACALIGLTLAVVLFPLYRKIAARLQGPGPLALKPARARSLAALLTELTAMLVLTVGLLLPGLVLFQNRAFIAEKGVVLYQDAVDWGHVKKLALSDWMDLPRADGPDRPEAPDAPAPAPTAVHDSLKSLLEALPPLGPMALRSVAYLGFVVVEALVMLLVMHVSFLHGPDLWGHILEHVSGPWLDLLQRLGRRATQVLRGVYLVHGLTAIAAFLIAVPVFWAIVGRPYSFLAAVVAGVFQFIPLLGSVVLVTAMTAYYFLSGHGDQGWLCLLLAFPLVVGLPDLVIRPALARKEGHISPFTMLIGFSVGIGVFGVSGFVLGPLILELFVSFTALMLYGPPSGEPLG